MSYFTDFTVSAFLVVSDTFLVLSTEVAVESFVTFVVDPVPHDANTIVVVAIKNKIYFFINVNIVKIIDKKKFEQKKVPTSCRD
jgi:hypothetical protein